MTKEQFAEILEELMEKMENGPGSHTNVLVQIAEQHVAPKKLHEAIIELSESMGAIRLILKYLMFDLEATRRERDEFRMMLEDKE